MTRQYFGTDGVRGRVGQFPITPEFILRLGYASGCVLIRNAFTQKSANDHLTVLIGKDTRISGYMLESALEAGLIAAGVDVKLTGPIPTAGVAYLTRALRLSAGIVVSASHNPYQDNGIKFFSAAGTKFPDSFEADIEAQLALAVECVAPQALGRAQRIGDAAGRYIEFCKSTFPTSLNLYGIKIVLDCAHGAAYEIAPHVFHELGAEVVTIGAQPNGFNINVDCGVTHPQALRKALQEHQADLGIAFDGDADRVLMIDATGRIYNGDELLYVLVRDGLAQGKSSGVVGTLMTNLAIEQAFERLGVPFVRAQVGDRYVLEMLHEHDWLWGGESSGHILALDKHSTGDGIISALQILCAVRRTGRSLADLTQDIAMFPQQLINVPITKEFDWERYAPLLEKQKSVAAELGSHGRILIRASGTEPLLRIMVEAKHEVLARNAAQQLAAVIPGIND